MNVRSSPVLAQNAFSDFTYVYQWVILWLPNVVPLLFLEEPTVKKLSLKIEELEVKSFETAIISEARGTVQGNLMAASGPWYCFGTMVCSVLCTSEPNDP